MAKATPAKKATRKRITKPKAAGTSSTTNPREWFVEWIRGGTESESGYTVTPATALTYAYVWQAVLIISGDVAGLPLNVFRRMDDDTREADREHPAYWLLNEDATPWMSGRTMRETLTSHALLWGNGYAVIGRQAGRPVRLTPLSPAVTECKTRGMEVYYETRLDTGETREYQPQDVLHVKGLGYDGLCGYSVVTMARNSLGLGLSLQRHGNTHFKNGAYPGVVLKTTRMLDKPDADRILANWEHRHGGSDNTKKTALLMGGLDLTTLPVSNEDAQWLESRRFQAKEVAAWFNLPPHKLGDESRTSYNSLETEERSYITTTLKHWIDRWEDECNRKLISPVERVNRTFYIEHNLAERLRPDTLQRFQGYEVGIRNRWLSPNEVRRMENLPPREGGDSYENPNTSSPRQPTNPPAEDDPSDNTEAVNAHRRLVTNAVNKLVTLEVERVRRMANKADFASMLDSFYDGHYQATWIREMQPILDASTTIAELTTSDAAALYTTHAAASRHALAEVVGRSYPDTISGEVVTETENWMGRVEPIVTYLFGA